MDFKMLFFQGDIVKRRPTEIKPNLLSISYGDHFNARDRRSTPLGCRSIKKEFNAFTARNNNSGKSLRGKS
jgi:hypothetical protein